MRLRLLILLVLICIPTLTTQAGSTGPLVFDIDWSPDARWMAVSTREGLWLYDVENRDAEPVRYFEDSHIPTAAFNNDGTRLTFFNEDVEKMLVMDVESGKLVAQMTPERPESESFPVLYDLQYSADGTRIAFANTSRFFVIDAGTADEIASFNEPSQGDYGYSQWIISVTSGPDEDTYMTLDWNDTLSAFNVDEGLVARYEMDAEYSVEDVKTLDPTHYFVLTFTDLLLFNTDTGELTPIDNPYGEWVAGVELNQEQTLMAVGGMGGWALYTVDGDEFTLEMTVDTVKEEQIFDLDFSADSSRLATLQTDGAITIWDTATGEALQTIGAFENAVSPKWG
jgi:WD40 repeat protein